MTRKYSYDTTFFSELDAEIKSYWAGFLLADGCVQTQRKGCSTSLKLGAKDIEHLAAFRTALQATAPISSSTTKDGRTLYELRIHGRELLADLARYGIVPRKTKGHPMPAVPDTMLPHFVRGYVDGDGYIGRRGHATAHAMQYQLVICATEAFAIWLRDTIGREAGSSAQLRPSKGCYRVSLSGNPNVARALEWLYDGATVALERKRSVAMECVRLYSESTESTLAGIVRDVAARLISEEAALCDILRVVRRAGIAETESDRIGALVRRRVG
jgi:hypothetical protein